MNRQVTLYIELGLFSELKNAAFLADKKISHFASDAIREFLNKLPTQEISGKVVTSKANPPTRQAGNEIPSILKALAEQAKSISDLKNEFLKLKPSKGPESFAVPDGPFTEVERGVLNIICGAGAEGIAGLEFQRRMESLHFTVGQSRTATSKLQKNGFLKRKRSVWVFLEQKI